MAHTISRTKRGADTKVHMQTRSSEVGACALLTCKTRYIRQTHELLWPHPESLSLSLRSQGQMVGSPCPPQAYTHTSNRKVTVSTTDKTETLQRK